MKKTLEEQIAELTPEQKSNMKTIYKKYCCYLISLFLIFVLGVAGGYSYFAAEEAEAKAQLDALKSKIEMENNIESITATAEGRTYIPRPLSWSAEHEQYYNMGMAKSKVLMIGGAIAMVSIVTVFVIFKKKYPYFSEKKYKYLKKHNML